MNSYKIVRITNLYKEIVALFYRDTPNVQHQSYDDQLEAIINYSFDLAISFVKNIRKQGVEASIIITNAPFLNQKWKEENNSDQNGLSLVLEQVAKINPDIVWLDDPALMETNWINELRTKSTNIKIVCGHVCAPYGKHNIEAFRKLDIMFTCIPCMKIDMEKQGINAFQLYHSFDEDILQIINIDNLYPSLDVLFTGSLFVGGGFHNTRIEYIEHLLKNGIPISVLGNKESNSKIALKKGFHFTINLLRYLHAESLIDSVNILKKHKDYGNYPVPNYSSALKKSIFPPVFGVNMFKQLSRAKICFNIHGDIAGSCAGNVRLFEATGVGTCLISDWKENLADIFEPEKEIITYKSKEECAEKITWYLHHPEDLKKIAKAGQMRILKDHTHKQRAAYCHEIFLNFLSR